MAFMMMRLNFVHPDPTDAEHMSDRYRAGIDLAEYADKNGFAMVSTEEHTATALGWSPTPLLTAAMTWGLYAAWEWLVQIKTPEANIRVDLLVMWPVLAILSVWMLFRAFR